MPTTASRNRRKIVGSALFSAFPLCAALLGLGCSPPRGIPHDVPRRVPPIAQADTQTGTAARECVRSWPEARYRSYAYDHVVHLSSTCHRDASCLVATNVTPKPVVVAVAPGEHVEVVTLRASESPDFTPNVKCSWGTH